MSKNLYTLLLLLLGSLAHAQITLSNDYFPEVGDTLKYNVAPDDSDIDLLSPGPNRQWNFGDLDVVRELTLPVTSAAGDTVFTDADVAMDIDTVTTGYYRIGETALELVGLRGRTPLLAGYTVEAQVSPARAERHAPLAYGDSYTSSTTNVIVVPTDSLPEELLADLEALSSVDSIRLTTGSERQDEVDAYGTLTIGNRTYDVLRETRVESLVTKVEVKTGALPYFDITGTLQALAPEFAPFLGEQAAVTTYYFWAQGRKEAIATVTEENDGSISRLTFIRGDATNSLSGPFLRQATINVYPNPAYGQTTFAISGLDAGNYTIRVLNVLGRKVAATDFSPSNGEAEVPINLNQLPRGTYLYSLTNERGRILTTRRLMIGG